MSGARQGDRICLACRTAALSQYNPDPLCSACVRSSREPHGVVPIWLWDSEPMREALARLDIPAVIAIFRAASGLSQLELGNLVDGWSQSLVSLTERGLRDTLYDVRKLLAFADTVGMPWQALLPLILGQQGATLESANDDAFRGVHPMGMDRRDFSTLAVGLAASVVLPIPARADRAHVRYLRSVLTQLRSQDHMVGGGALLGQALRHFGHARRILDESDHTASIGRELLVITADLGVQSAWFAYDANNQTLARQLYGEAALLADSAGANEQRVRAYAGMLRQCVYLARHTGRPGPAREALRFAERAADAARYEPSPALHALIALRQSLAHTQLGDNVAFRSSITTARRELDRGPHEADPMWTKFVSHSEITDYEAMAYAECGALDQPVQLYCAVLEDTARSPRDQAYYRTLLAGSLIRSGDHGQAISEGLTVLPSLARL